ncbi:LacI family DNA-binding transcriptional regulator [Moorellaceae bacterium AZ2]
MSAGAKVVTIKDVAHKAGVAPSTVSRVMNNSGYVSAEVKERVLKAIEELGFRPNPMAKGLGGGHTYTIGLILPDITNAFFPSLARSIEDTASVHGYTVFLCNSDNEPANEEKYLRTLVQRFVDGIIIVGSSSESSCIQEVASNGIPVVLIDRRVEGVAADSVFCDNIHGAYLAVTHLLDEGHREIAFLGGPLDVSTTREREQGYILAHQEKGVPIDRSLISYGEFTYESGFKQMTDLLERGRQPSAVFAANDMLAIGANRAIEGKNLRVPEDISIVGYDDILWAALEKPPLTTVAQPVYRLGMTACEILLERINRPGVQEPRQVVLQPRLIIRQSTCKKGNRIW